MLFEALRELLQDYTYLTFLLALLVLSLWAGLLSPADGSRAGNCSQGEVTASAPDDRVPPKIRGHTEAITREEIKHEDNAKSCGLNQDGGSTSKQSESRPRALWPRSLSLGQRHGKPEGGGGGGELQDWKIGRPAAACAPLPAEEKMNEAGVERKASLTGEELKELADAFIARMRHRLRLQRQESYQARLDRSA